MHNQITFKGGIALMAMSLIFLSSCKKEEITKQTTSQSENKATEMPSYKFSAVAKIPGENPENGFLSVTVSSDDQAYLKKYIAKLEQTKVFMEGSTSSNENEENIHPLLEEESGVAVSLFLSWKDFSFQREKGKIYALKLTDKTQSKALNYYYSLNNVASFTIGGTVAAVNVHNTYRVWNIGCFCWLSTNNSKWIFRNGAGDFYSQILSYNDNFEIRCFRGAGPSSPGTGFGSFTVSGITTFYRTRLNYVSPEMPTGYTDQDAITSGVGLSLTQQGMPAVADLTFYIQ